MSKVAKVTIGLMISTLIAKFLGFGRELVLASAYGASKYSDAYIIAMNIPTVIFTIIGTTLGTVLIPMYFEVDKELGEKNSLKFINNVLNIVILMCIILSVIGIIFAEEIVKIFAMGFNGDRLTVAVKFTKVSMLGITFTGLSYIMNAYLQIKNNFIIPGIVTVPRNIIIIVSIILSIIFGPYLMIWGALIGVISEFLFQIPFAIKKGYKYSLYINIKDKYIKNTLLLIGPVLIGVGVNQINALVDKTLASTLVEGSISALNYANKLNLFVMSMFISSIAIVIYPILSRLSNNDNKDEFIKSVIKSINSVIILIIPITVGAIVLAKPIVKLLFERGNFDSVATEMTYICLIMYSLGMLSAGLRDILGRIFYSLKDTKTPMINGVIAMSFNIILNIIFIKKLKIAGLALATSLSSIICTSLLFVSLSRKIGYFGQDKVLKTGFKSFASSIIMGFITFLTYNTVNNILGNGVINEIIALFTSISIGAFIYGIILILLKIEEISLIEDIIKKKINKQINK